MEKDNTNGGSVYITLDKHFNPVHISMKGTGEEGFLEFMQEDVEKALKETEMPAVGMMYYNVPNMGIVPPLQEGNNEDYLQRLEKRWTNMELSCIDTCVCRKWCILYETTSIRCQGMRIIPGGSRQRCGRK